MKNNQKTHLLKKSGELFMKHGIKKLTMDDVAKELGMSKKTIYQYVENKAELVELTMNAYLQEDRTKLDAILKASKNSIDDMIQMLSYFVSQLREFNPAALNDFQKYYPALWTQFTEYRLNYSLTRISQNLKNGIKQGDYRRDLNADIVARIYIVGVDILVNPQLFPVEKFKFIDTYKEYLNYHLRGIVSQQGLKFLEEHNFFKA